MCAIRICVATLTPRRPEYGGSLDSKHLIGNKRGLPAQAFFLRPVALG